MSKQRQVGIEAEFFLLNPDGNAIVIPERWDRDSFTILGEVRGAPGNTTAEAIGNYYKRYYEVENKLKRNHQIVMEPMRLIDLKAYQKAMRDMNAVDKFDAINNIHNIYGTDISEYSDQVLKAGKIQGAKASCGLHIHFSCVDYAEQDITKDTYTSVNLPISVGDVSTYLSLYKMDEKEVKEKIRVEVSLLTKPAIEWMVKEMDEAFFEKFAPPEGKRTKYRQPGFYELKPHGFEYRSLPATKETVEALPEIVGTAFDLISTLSKKSW